MTGFSPTTLALIGIMFFIPILPNLWAIWHIFHSDFPSVAEKMGWLFAAMFLPVLGGLAYCVWGRKKGTHVNRQIPDHPAEEDSQ